jgi:membrane-associated phospholipid phosphatase
MKAILYDWGGANVWLFHAINGIHSGILDRFMMLGTLLAGHDNFPVYLGFACLFAIGSLSGIRIDQPDVAGKRAMRWLLTISVLCIAYMLDGQMLNLVKPWLDFPRPLLALPPSSVHIFGRPEYHYSLPSGHASFAMLVVASLWPMLSPNPRKFGLFFVVWAGLSRICLGAHFPADVLAGYVSAFLIVLAVRWVLKSTLAPA